MIKIRTYLLTYLLKTLTTLPISIKVALGGCYNRIAFFLEPLRGVETTELQAECYSCVETVESVAHRERFGGNCECKFALTFSSEALFFVNQFGAT